MNFCYFPNSQSFNAHLEQKNCSNLGKKFKPRNAPKDKSLVFIYSAATTCAGLGTIGFALRKKDRTFVIIRPIDVKTQAAKSD